MTPKLARVFSGLATLVGPMAILIVPIDVILVELGVREHVAVAISTATAVVVGSTISVLIDRWLWVPIRTKGKASGDVGQPS